MTTDVKVPTRFPVLEVSGRPRELGRQIGEAMREEIKELVELVVQGFNKMARPTGLAISLTEAVRLAAGTIPFAQRYAPNSMEELQGTAEAAGLPIEQLMVINARNILGLGEVACTSVMVSADASATGRGMVGQNWDNDPALEPFSVVLIRRPTGKPSFMNWTQPGIIGYLGFNSQGMGVCLNALNGPSHRDGIPWYFTVRALLEQSSLDGAVAALKRARRTISANAAMITPQGVADIEATPECVRLLRAGREGLLVHTNHCLHPDLLVHNETYAGAIFGQSVPRKSRAESMLHERDGPTTLETVKHILRDHEGYPTSICRHPNQDPSTGWHRSVVSMIVEPAASRMHLTRGNPCQSPFEVYDLN